MTLSVYITVDIEVWPCRANWPIEPLGASDACLEEIEAYLWGRCAEGHFGLVYQTETLQRYGLMGTFFVDPMFSVALGLPVLRDVVGQITSMGHRVELHLHPEWLTDPRCAHIAAFKGAMLGDYPEAVQSHLLEVAIARLIEAGAERPRAFRAGSWGASRTTLQQLPRLGIRTDSSLNSYYPQSLPDVPHRDGQSPARIDEVVEMPVTRFDDHRTLGGKPLSVVGVSFRELTHVLEELQRCDASSAVLVLHGNEFVRTENLSKRRKLKPRRLVVGRFERLCRWLAERSDRYTTRAIADHVVSGGGASQDGGVVSGRRVLTLARLAEQALSRWY